MDAVAVIQAHHTDLLAGDMDATHYCVAALRKCDRVDRIVLAAADIPENRVLRDAAEAWGIDVFLGSEFDVIARIIGAVGQEGVQARTPVARVLLNRFYLDPVLLDALITELERENADFVSLPYDFDINFGADVFTLGCMQRADELLKDAETAQRFRPWLFIEENTDAFRTVTLGDVPEYPASMLSEIRGSGLFAERDCGTCSAFGYEYLIQFLGPEDIVLDVGCGTGESLVAIADVVREVHGADYDEAAVDEARAKCDRENIEFCVQDALHLTFDEDCFDVVVCSNVMEHVPDDRRLLDNCWRVLKPGGRLILEVPLLRARPFGFPLLDSHLREYQREPLLSLVSDAGFVTTHKFGMNRGRYVDWNRAREGALVVACKAK